MTREFTIATLLCASAAFSQEAPKKISLVDAVQFAMKNSPQLGAAIADADAAKSGARGSKARTLPQLSVNAFSTTGNNSSILSSSPMVEPPAWMLVPTGNFTDGNLSLMVPIIAPRLQAMAGSASWQAKAAAGELSEARADVSLQVTDAYERVLLYRQMVLTAQAKVDATQELVRTTRALFDAGKGIEATVQRSAAELSQAERSLTSARNDEAKAILDLEAAMGADFSTPLDPSETLKGSSVTDTLDKYLSSAKESRGMILAARARQEAAAAEIRGVEGQRFPQLYGTVMGDRTSRHDMGGVTAGLTLSFPVFDGGRISAEVSQAKSMKAKADAGLKLAEITVAKEVRQAWLDVQSAQANATSAEASVAAAQSAYDVTVLRVTVGKSILIEQLDALEALTRARADLAQATFDQVLAVARLNRAAGRQL